MAGGNGTVSKLWGGEQDGVAHRKRDTPDALHRGADEAGL